MTPALDLQLDTDHPVRAGVAEMHLVLDRLQHGPPGPLSSGEHARMVVELDRAIRRITALKLKIPAEGRRRDGRTTADARARTAPHALPRPIPV